MNIQSANQKEAFLLFCAGLSVLLLLLTLVVLLGKITGAGGLSILSLFFLLIPFGIIAAIPALFLYSLSMQNGQEMSLFPEYRLLLKISPYSVIVLLIILILL